MSYSLSTARADTKEGVIEALDRAFDLNVMATQPIHAFDRATHFENLRRQLDLLPPLRDGYEYTATINGYLSWERTNAEGKVTPLEITGAGFGCSVGMSRKREE